MNFLNTNANSFLNELTFEKSMRNNKIMYEHFKLVDTFEGLPLFTFHEDFQFTAKPAETDKKESWQGSYGNT